MSQYRGFVRWFNNAKGYGFLAREDGQADVFVHHTAIEGDGFRSLTQGEEVEFDVLRGTTGKPQAAGVHKTGVRRFTNGREANP